MSRLGRGLQELSKLIGCQPCVASDSAHGERVDGVVAWDRDDAGIVGHDDVFALPGDSKAGFLKRAWHRDG